MLLTVLAIGSGTAGAGEVKLATADGAALVGTSWGTGARGVLLVHDEGRSRVDWDLIGPRLASAGFRVLAIDLRGHGKSAAAPPPAEGDWSPLAADLRAGVDWLGTSGATEIHVVGERLGANLALTAAAAESRILDVVLVSPSLNQRGVRVSTSIGGLGERSLLVLAGASDPMAVKASTWLAEQAAGPHRVELFQGSATGQRVLSSAPEAVNLVVTWLDGGFSRVPVAGDAGPALRSGEVGKIETTGTRLEDRQR